MVQYHKNVKRKSGGSGGLRRKNRDKILSHYGGFFSRTRLTKGDEKQEIKSFHVIGGKHKVAVQRIEFVNVALEKGKVKKIKITNVLESPANRHYARENIITKGAVVNTEAGKARITSRPGQDGTVNAVLIEKASKA
ncbi:MAG: 30S ribosomal protein S8e [Candidatus Micrarchaeota archaeon]